MSTTSFNRPRGDITTLLDLTPRDAQDDAYTPLQTDASWFSRDPDRRVTPFVPVMQEFQYRGPGAFGQRFTFDLASLTSGDIIVAAVLQIQMTHWLPLDSILKLSSQTYSYSDPQTAWFYANSLGTILIQSCELEVDGDTLETVDGDWSNCFSLLFPDLNSQFGIGVDHYGRANLDYLKNWPPYRIFPTENGYIHCILPFSFGRTRLREAFPLIACREGTVRIHVTLRPFSEVVRQLRGFRDTCDATPLNQTFQLKENRLPFPATVSVQSIVEPPTLQNVRLLTWGAMLEGNIRNAMIYKPFEIMHREVQTFYFSEPLKYVVAKQNIDDIIRIQLPLEANHPIEEIIWFIRRKAVSENNDWTNYSNVTEREFDPIYRPREGMLLSAKIQANGITLVEAEEQYFRQLIARHHRGGDVAFTNFVYGYPIARWPGEQHQPSGSLNASRLSSLRLTLDVRPPSGGMSADTAWEVKVFCLSLNWYRFQNGILNRMFQD
jgi:hypothetical protein